MIISDSKKQVIENMRRYAETGELNHKVEEGDPELSAEEAARLRGDFYKMRGSLKFRAERKATYVMIEKVAKEVIDTTEIVGYEKLSGVSGGVIITSNHFNPVDTLVVRKMVKEWRGAREEVQIVVQETNLALPEQLGFIMNHLDTVPLPRSAHAVASEFKPYLSKLLEEGKSVLIYPEEEMWFYYRKPRPCRPGAYRFAAENRVPVVSCFAELVDTPEKDNEEFCKVKFVGHILGVIRPDATLSARENAKKMADEDYRLKVAAYEEIYGKKLDYKFEETDVAGWHGSDGDE